MVNEYYAVFENAERTMEGFEPVQISYAFCTYAEAYDEFVLLGGLDENSNLTIEVLRENFIEEV